MRIILVFLFAFVGQLSFAQCDDTKQFSEAQKESFVRVYLKLKLVKPTIQDAKLFELTEKYNITPSQFREIQGRSELKRALTSEERAFIAEFEILEDEFKSRLQLTEKQVCQVSNLDYEVYHEIQHQYKSCMQFQRSLSQYFEKWMK